jgi:hypothetical protein
LFGNLVNVFQKNTFCMFLIKECQRRKEE